MGLFSTKPRVFAQHGSSTDNLLVRYLPLFYSLVLFTFCYRPISVDETGDFFAWTRNPENGLIRQATYGTLFNFRRVETTPAIDLLSTKPVVPAQPQPVSLGPTSILGSWFNFGQSMTGAQIDALRRLPSMYYSN